MLMCALHSGAMHGGETSGSTSCVNYRRGEAHWAEHCAASGGGRSCDRGELQNLNGRCGIVGS